MDDLEPGDPERLGRFSLVGRIGSGGMGVVYLARTEDGTSVALKVIRPELAREPTFRRRFGREVHAAQQVKSPVTVAVLDADADGDVPWVAFEYVAGPNLEQVMTARPPRLSAAVGILGGIAEALAAIHGAGIVHRDLKPSNVLCPPDGVKVIDFGIAAALGASSLTDAGALIGTPAWLAPEQINDEPITPAVDVFAWGCISVYVLTGHLAFGTGDEAPAALLYRIANGSPDLRGVPETLAPLVSAALSKRPENRPGVDRLLRELLAATAGPAPRPSGATEAGNDTVVELAPTGVSGPPRRRRRRRVDVVAGVVALVVVVGVVAIVVLLATLGQQYLAIVGPANDAFFTFTTDAAALPPSATGADLARLAAPGITATNTAIQSLLRVGWPEPAPTDVRALVAADSQLVTDLENADLLSFADATKQIEQDLGKTRLAGSTVRADLGLPAPK